MSDLQELVRVLTKRELDILMLEQNPVFMYVQVSAAEKMLKEIERLRGILASIGRAADDVLSHRREGAGGINLHVEWVSEQCQKAGGNDE